MATTATVSEKRNRTYIPESFEVKDWDSLKPYYEYLVQQSPQSAEELEVFIRQVSELEAVVQEDMAWRYIRMTCNTQDENLVAAYQFFVQNIMPHISTYEDKLNRKIIANPYFSQLPQDPYLTYTRSLKQETELFREENIPLSTNAQSIAQKYGATIGKMTIEHDGQTYTLQQAARFWESKNRELRESIWRKVYQRRAKDQGELEALFAELQALRHQIAQNAGFESYTQYKFASLGRFDYSLEDTHAFHNAIEKVVKPVYEELMKERKRILGVESLRPWDLTVDILGDEPLHPFKNEKTLINKTVELFGELKPELGEMIRLMEERGHLDLESRVGKAPGGYNYPLAESGIPFIFMNSTGTQVDVTTMLHEGGHAIHAFLCHELDVNALRRTPSEVAELASMTMELLALDHYQTFYPDADDRSRAIKEQLNRCLLVLPWVATVDAFQQWLYNHPNSTAEQQGDAWVELYRRFHGDVVDWSGLEDDLRALWLKQGHIFEVPFYYIEYGIAQLGALAIWRNFRQNTEQGLSDYLEALKLGYTRTIPEIYETAGIHFDFSEDYVQELVDFCFAEYNKL